MKRAADGQCQLVSDGQAEAGSTGIAVAGLFETIEGLQDRLELAFRDARPVIEHGDAGSSLRRSPDDDFCLPGEFETRCR